MTKRRKARFIATNVLYIADLLELGRSEALSAFLSTYPVDSEEIKQYALSLIDGVFVNMEAIDKKINETVKNWNIKRLSVVDRNIIRLGAYELLFENEMPPKVAINEAIEIAKEFSAADSGKFVNGVLDKIKNLR